MSHLLPGDEVDGAAPLLHRGHHGVPALQVVRHGGGPAGRGGLPLHVLGLPPHVGVLGLQVARYACAEERMALCISSHYPLSVPPGAAEGGGGGGGAAGLGLARGSVASRWCKLIPSDKIGAHQTPVNHI